MSPPSSPPGPPELSDGARISYGHAATYGEEIEPRLAKLLAERSEIAPDASMMPTSSSDDAATVLAGSVSGGRRHTTSGKVSKNVTEAEGTISVPTSTATASAAPAAAAAAAATTLINSGTSTACSSSVDVDALPESTQTAASAAIQDHVAASGPRSDLLVEGASVPTLRRARKDKPSHMAGLALKTCPIQAEDPEMSARLEALLQKGTTTGHTF